MNPTANNTHPAIELPADTNRALDFLTFLNNAGEWLGFCRDGNKMTDPERGLTLSQATYSIHLITKEVGIAWVAHSIRNEVHGDFIFTLSDYMDAEDFCQFLGHLQNALSHYSDEFEPDADEINNIISGFEIMQFLHRSINSYRLHRRLNKSSAEQTTT